jgi:hypothetical protein
MRPVRKRKGGRKIRMKEGRKKEREGESEGGKKRVRKH